MLSIRVKTNFFGREVDFTLVEGSLQDRQTYGKWIIERA